MKHKQVFIIILILIFTIFVSYRWYINSNSTSSIHEHINISDVESVEIEGSAIKCSGIIF